MDKVRIIFKTHLDIGFTDMAERVKQKYFSTFIRDAVATADAFRRDKSGFRYVWTVGSWLIREYLERSSAADRVFLKKAISRGDIVWHALPFTPHSEYAGGKLFRAGLAISQELDHEFGKKTIAAKLTDVPGHTRGIIAPLAEAGVELLHIGINPTSAVVDVPPVFRWRDSGGRELLVIYQASYGESVRCGDTLYRIEMTGDNQGPHSPAQVRAILAAHAGCDVRSTTLNDLAEELRPLWDSFPVVTSEIGDTWIHGVGTDPVKTAHFRELERLYESWGDFPQKRTFERRLLEVAEHTWGMDEKKYFPNFFDWDGARLDIPMARRFAASWREQRQLIDGAVAILPDNLQRIARHSLRRLTPRPGKLPSSPTHRKAIENDFFRLELDPARGCAKSLLVKANGFEFRHPGLLYYHNFTRQDYNRFRRQYLRLPEEPWAIHDFTKPDMPDAAPEKAAGFPSEFHAEKDRVLFISKTSGFFERLETEYRLGKTLEIRIRWFGKTRTRRPHAAWASFLPAQPVKECRLLKLDEEIDPLDVVSRGGRTLHAVRSVRLDGKVTVTPLDSALAAPGKMSLLDFHDRLPDLNRGIHFNLYNNIWGTNFPMWFGDDMEFRFIIAPE